MGGIGNYVCIFVCMYAYAWVCAQVYMCYVCLYLHYMCSCMWMSVLYMLMYVCIFVFMYVCDVCSVCNVCTWMFVICAQVGVYICAHICVMCVLTNVCLCECSDTGVPKLTSSCPK